MNAILEAEAPTATDTETLSRRLTAAYDAGDEDLAPNRIEAVLAEICGSGELVLPAAILAPKLDGYTRRLVFRDPNGRFSVLAMVWGPGQGTALHDHDGLWCVECVLAGAMDSEAFEKVEEAADGRARFESLFTETSLPGVSGLLVPPLEFHVMRNPDPSAIAVTLHVYQGELTQCRAYHSEGDGWYRPELRSLSYTP